MTTWTGQQLEFAYFNMIPASLVGCANRKVVLSTTPARDVGISHLTCSLSSARFYIPPSGERQETKSVRGIPLESPGLHNPVKRNGQQRRIIHGVSGEIGCKIGNVG